VSAGWFFAQRFLRISILILFELPCFFLFDGNSGAKVYLGSAELGAVTALLGRLPKPAEFLKIYKEKIEPNKDKIYKYLQFDEMPEYK